MDHINDPKQALLRSARSRKAILDYMRDNDLSHLDLKKRSHVKKLKPLNDAIRAGSSVALNEQFKAKCDDIKIHHLRKKRGLSKSKKRKKLNKLKEEYARITIEYPKSLKDSSREDKKIYRDLYFKYEASGMPINLCHNYALRDFYNK